MSASDRWPTQQQAIAALWLVALAPRWRRELEAVGHAYHQQDALCMVGLLSIDDRPESHRNERRGTPDVTITDRGRQVLLAEVIA